MVMASTIVLGPAQETLVGTVGHAELPQVTSVSAAGYVSGRTSTIISSSSGSVKPRLSSSARAPDVAIDSGCGSAAFSSLSPAQAAKTTALARTIGRANIRRTVLLQVCLQGRTFPQAARIEQPLFGANFGYGCSPLGRRDARQARHYGDAHGRALGTQLVQSRVVQSIRAVPPRALNSRDAGCGRMVEIPTTKERTSWLKLDR